VPHPRVSRKNSCAARSCGRTFSTCPRFLIIARTERQTTLRWSFLLFLSSSFSPEHCGTPRETPPGVPSKANATTPEGASTSFVSAAGNHAGHCARPSYAPYTRRTALCAETPRPPISLAEAKASIRRRPISTAKNSRPTAGLQLLAVPSNSEKNSMTVTIRQTIPA